jgi:hypothetical protein
MSQTNIPNAVVVVIDRLGANMLGAYGSTWFETENFNRLAARSIVFDQAITSTTDLPDAYADLWSRSGIDKNLIQEIGGRGASSFLLPDDPVVEQLGQVGSFDRVISIAPQSPEGVADSIAQTELASFFAQATQLISEMDSGSLGWLHSRGLSGNWDAPCELRTRLAHADDPPPPEFFRAPSRMFDPEVDDPDELLGYQQVCAAQVTLIDDFLGVVLDLMESEIGKSTLFCLTSTRGYPLGEHRLVGECDTGNQACLNYNESVHVPMMICLPDRPEFESFRAIRNGSLVQPNWLSACLTDWFSGHEENFERRIQSVSDRLPEKLHEAVCICNGDSQAIQTHAWKLIRSRSDGNGSTCELFAKPDDRWEVNDVSRRCPQIVEALSTLLDQWSVDGKLSQPDRIELPAELAIREG